MLFLKNPSDRRLVIGAHYDSIAGSTGANDNAASVSILIKLAKKMENTDKSIDFVFFDREEYPNRGSEAYIDFIGAENIAAMINLDVCGYGETIAIAIKNNLDNNKFYNVLTHQNIEEHNAVVLGFLPNGDDSAFDMKGIDNVSIAILPEDDVHFFQKAAKMLTNGQSAVEEVQREFMNIFIVSTMHNGINDNIGFVSQTSMDTVFKFLYDGLSY